MVKETQGELLVEVESAKTKHQAQSESSLVAVARFKAWYAHFKVIINHALI